MRGLLWRNATKKLFVYQQRIVPLLIWIDMYNADWEQAAYFWADARQRGKQLSDPDLLLAAVAHREKAIVVSSDGDFDALSIQSENWRLDTLRD